MMWHFRWCTKRVGVAAGLTMLFASGGLQSASRPDVVIRHVNVVDVASAQIRANQRVAVQRGRITAIEPEQRAPAPAAKVIDARGKFLIPGLWDMHVHLVLPELQTVQEAAQMVLPLFLANGVLGAREMGAWDVDIAPLVRLRDEIEAGKRRGPHLVITGTRISTSVPLKRVRPCAN